MHTYFYCPPEFSALLTTTAALLIALTIASGGYSTNSHAIHVNVIICLLLVDLISLVGIRSVSPTFHFIQLLSTFIPIPSK